MDSERIIEHFASLKKSELKEIADFFEFPVTHGCRKDVLLHEVCGFLSDDPEAWLSMLPQRDILMLKKLLEGEPAQPHITSYPDNISVIELLKIVDSVYSDSEYRKIWIDSSIYDLISPYISSIIEKKESDGSFMIERVILGYLYIYGMISGSDLVDILFKDHGFDTDFETVNDLILSCPIIKIYRETIDGESYFFSPNLYDFKEVLYKRAVFPDINGYKYFTWNEAASAGASAPFNIIGLNTPEGLALERMLADLDYGMEERAAIIHRIWYCSQFAGDEEASEELFDCITDRQDWFGTFEEYKRCIDIVVAYANSIPKWVLNGHSANEMNLMKISIKIDMEDSAEDIYEGPHYECAALCNSSGKDGWAWMIFSRSDNLDSKFKRTVAS